MEWEPEHKDLGALGLAGICRETSRVVRRAILPNFTNVGPPRLSALFLANAAALRALIYRLDSDYVRVVTGWAAFLLLDIVILGLLLLCTEAYALCVNSVYSTGGDLLAADRVLKKDLPVVSLKRLVATFVPAVLPFFLLFCSLFVLALLRVELAIVLPLPLRLLVWAGPPHAAVVFQLSCVISVLEDAAIYAAPCLCGAVRRSVQLLAGKYWAAACVFVTLDGCIVAVLKAFTVLVVDDALGLLAFQVASAAAMFVALSQLLLVTLVAQPVVYMVSKSHHHEVVDKDHLD